VADMQLILLPRLIVFHQADGAGYPVMDLGHVVTALNKLDAADEEKIVLASRDGKSMMVVSYADVARCLESAYLELCSSAAAPASLQY
jgi:PAB-dependent poly(A)-specific ribonuclease subunit 3